MFCLLHAWLQCVGSCSAILVEPSWAGNAFAPVSEEQDAAPKSPFLQILVLFVEVGSPTTLR